MKIGNINIGTKHKPIVIAELGINHNGSIERAIKIADAAIKSGAKIIKHQTHIPEDEMSLEAKKIKPGNSKMNIFDIIKNCSLNEEDEFKLMKYIQKKNRIFISTPFSRKAVDRLIKFKIPAFKIGSGECNNYLLVEYIAKQKKPIILSTGMNSIEQIKPAVQILRKNKVNYALLHCTNIYPTPPELVRLNCLSELKKNFKDAVIGLSDHTNSNFSSYGALALGASIIEKHFVDDKSKKGPDIPCSMDPSDLKKLIEGSKIISLAKRPGKKEGLKEETKTINFAFASVVSIKEIFPGEKLNQNNIWVKRPGLGDYLAKDFKKLIGKKVKIKINKDTFIKKTHLK